jgi:hypothetical protein
MGSPGRLQRDMSEELPVTRVDEREQLARRQAELVRAIHGQGPAPEGFDIGKFLIAADSLARKRSRSVQKAWPGVSGAMGDAFFPEFESYVRQFPVPKEDPGLDGLRFARWLESRGALPSAGRIELARWRVGRGIVPRVVWSDDRRGVALIVRWWRGVRVFTLGWGRSDSNGIC